MNDVKSSLPSQRKTFAEAYCAQHHLPQEKFAHDVLIKSLHAPAKILYPFITLFSPGHFQADLDLVQATGRLRRTRDYAIEVAEFVHHPANSGFWRSTMDLRISTGRLRRLLRNTLHAEHTIERPHPEIQSTNEPGQNEDSDETALPFAIADAKPGGPNLQEKHHA